MPRHEALPLHKVYGRVALAEQAERWRHAGRRIVFANGCFDGLHGGHVSYLQDSARQGDVLVVGVNDDASVRGLKGEGRPVVLLEDRAAMLASLEWTDAVVAFGEPTCAELLRELRPAVHAKGTDYTSDTVPERDTALELGIEIYIAGPPKENATRKILEKIRQGAEKA